jgi:hypothetical protein
MTARYAPITCTFFTPPLKGRVMVGMVTILAAVSLLAMIALGIGLTWLSLQDDRHAPHIVRSDDTE